MSFLVTFRDKTGITVKNEDGEAIKELLLTNPKPAVNIEIAGDMWRSSEIVSVTKTEDPRPMSEAAEAWANSASQMIDQPKEPECRGEFSIQKEIHKLIVDEHRSNWPGAVQNKKLRAKYRNQLLAAQPDGWCDYKAGKCACEFKTETFAHEPLATPAI